MYTNFDLLELEKKTNEELNIELRRAKENYDYVQSLYAGECDENPFEAKIPLDVIFMHLKNIEHYIRRIENLLNEYEVDIVFIKKAVNRRKKRFSRLMSA